MVPKLAAQLQTVRILWAALFGSTLLFIVVLAKVRGQSGYEPPHFVPVMGLALGAVAVMTAGMSVVIPRAQLARLLARLELEIVSRPGDAIGSFRESAPTARVIANPDAALRAAFPAYSTTLIMGMALAESIALLGFLLVYMGGPPLEAAPFWVVAWALMASKFPTRGKITRALESATGAQCRP